MKEITQNTVWEKAKNFIQEKYGKTINFKSFNLSLRSDLFFIEGDDLVIPLKREQTSLGEVIVQSGQNLSQDQKLEVTDFVKFLIEPHVYNQHLMIKEEQFKLEKELNKFELVESTYSTNVYSLMNNSQDIDLEDEVIKNSKLISNIIHIKSSHLTLRHKVAFKLHELADNNLFMRYTDLSRSLNSVNDLIQLGRATILIENIDELSTNHLNLIEEASENSNCDVLFVIGSNKTEDEISALDTNFSLINKLNAFVFEIDRIPVAQQTSKDILELLFFNLDHSIES